MIPSIVQTIVNASQGNPGAGDVNIIILSIITTSISCFIGFLFCTGFLLVAMWQVKVLYDKKKALQV